MSIIEEIRRDVRHDDECPARSGSVNSVRGILCNDYVPPECNCTRRRKIAWLERLEEPTPLMVAAYMNEPTHIQVAGHDPEPREPVDIFFGQWKAMLKAAEEDL